MRMRLGRLSGGALLILLLSACAQTSQSNVTAASLGTSPPPSTHTAASSAASAMPASLPAAPPPSPSYAAAVASPGTEADDAGQVHSELAATTAAQHQLSRVHRPPGAALQHGALPRALQEIGEGDGESQNVDVDRWYVVPGDVAAVVRYVKAHPPAGYRAGDTSRDTNGGEQLFDFDPAPGTKAPSGMLSEGINSVGASTAVRVHVQVDWLPTRTRLESIPGTVTSATVHWTGPEQFGATPSAPPAQVDRTLTGAQLASVTKVLNSVQTTSPGMGSCPAPSGESVSLTFAYGGHREVFTDDFSGCTGIAVTVDGVQQPQLSRSEDWSTTLHRALGITAALDPGVGAEK